MAEHHVEPAVQGVSPRFHTRFTVQETSDTVCAPCVFFFLEQNVDINELCSEFTKKARCDGTKVVLEPEGVNDIIESLQAKRGPQ